MDRLKQQSPHMTRKQVRSRLNALDWDMGMTMLHADNQLRIPWRKYAWSPDLHKAGLLLRYWKSCQSDFYQESDSHCTHASIQQRLQQHDRRYQLPSADDMSDVEIRHEISQACAHLRMVRKTLRSFWPNTNPTRTLLLARNHGGRRPSLVVRFAEKLDSVSKNWSCSETEAIRRDCQSPHSPPPRPR